MELLSASPAKMILLTPEQHQKVLLNTRVKLAWFNVGGKFVGPYIDPADQVHL